MYIQLNKDYLQKNKKLMEKAAEEYEAENSYLIEDTKQETFHDLEFDDGNLRVNIETEVGLVSTNVPIDDDLALEIVNYLKSKGIRIKRLINIGE